MAVGNYASGDSGFFVENRVFSSLYFMEINLKGRNTHPASTPNIKI